MKLYWCPQTRSFQALWMLEEAGRPYERELVDIRSGAQSRPAYRAINPMGKVPALVDGAATVAETGAICAYVADAVPEAGLAPAVGDPLRGRYLQWLFFGGNCIEPAFMQKFGGWTVDPGSAGWGSYDRVVAVLEEALRPGGWILGERFTAADVVIGSGVYYGVRIFKLIEPRPVFDAYIDRLGTRPALQRAQAIEAEAVAAGPPTSA
jgi:glutathione S-transferase